MACLQCGKKVNEFYGIYISADGDAVCDTACHDRYNLAKDKFLNETIHDDTKFNNWIKGED